LSVAANLPNWKPNECAQLSNPTASKQKKKKKTKVNPYTHSHTLFSTHNRSFLSANQRARKRRRRRRCLILRTHERHQRTRPHPRSSSSTHRSRETTMGCLPSRAQTLTFPNYGPVLVDTSMLLGKGGFASVQLATHAISAEQVAVKRVRNSPVARREVELMRSLPTNAHLLPLIDVFETNGELILALPLCSGGSLQAIADQVRADRALAPSENDILRWFHHTCIAVAALHDRGIAHRDLKPANVLLRRTDRREALLCDFGSASAARVTVSNADQVMELADDRAGVHVALVSSARALRSRLWRHYHRGDRSRGRSVVFCYAVCFGINPFDAQLLRGGSVELAIRNVVMDVPEHGAKAFPRCVASFVLCSLLTSTPD
jgi:serine/threonine kinase 16